VTDLRLVRANGIRLAYRESGSPAATPVVLLHALGENSADWDPVAAALSETWHVYAPDLRGHGRSDWPGAYTLALLRDDVLGFLDALELPRAAMIGHSMGGAAAYLLAIRQPGRVTRLVLEEPAPPWPRVPRVPARPPGPLPFDWAVTRLSAEASHPPESSRAGLAAITAPTLIVAGGPDSQVSQDRLADMAALIPDARLVTIPAGHLVHAARPEAFLSAVTGFLGS